jgi:lipopolysaccharide transport system permease protein
MTSSFAGEPTQRSSVTPVTIIRPASGWTLPRLGEAWREREILWYFVLRDIKVRYTQTLLGALWAFFQPIGMLLIFTFAFSRLGNVQTEGVPYPVFAFAGLTLWTFFSRGVINAADSLVANAPLLTKSSMPRILLPVAALLSPLFDFAISFVLLVGFAALYGYYPTWRMALAPVATIFGFALAGGLSLVLCAANVQRRDVRNMLPMLVQVLLFLSPVVYSLDTLGKRSSTLLSIFNPLVGIVEAFRWTMLGTTGPSQVAVASSLVWVVGLLVLGLAYFGRVERRFADVA